MQMIRFLLVAPVVFVAAVAFAQAQDAFDVDVRYRARGGSDMPAVTITALRDLRDLVITVEPVDAEPKVFKVGRLAKGRSHTISIPQGPGQTFYRVEINSSSIRQAQEVSFAASVKRDFDLTVRGEDVDLAQGRIGFTATGQLLGVDLELIGEDGVLVVKESIRYSYPGENPSEFVFDPPTVPIIQAKIVAYDDMNFKTTVSFEPIVIDVPHEEVNFATDSSQIPKDQEPKLVKTLAEVNKALKKLGDQLKFRLYVAGYTDTVGSREHNQRLSEARAASIAAWMRANGLKIQVCSQGFGEDALAVETPDETDEPRNRRSKFVLAAQGPWTEAFPRANWSCR